MAFFMDKFSEYDAQTGITTTVHNLNDADRMVIQKTYDSSPFLDMAAEMRRRTEGEKWGEMRHVGTIPMAELATMMRQDGTIDNKRALAFLRANPAFATFSKVLK